MPDKLEEILRDECRLEKDKPILVGVSGGPDSLCLLSRLHEVGWQVIAAHFNHQLRPEAAREAEAVDALARRMQVPFVGGAADVRQHAAEQKLSIEVAARDLRYRFLFEQARQHRAQAVAVGHTADDQVETVLMHFIRGAGLRGLKGMAYRSFLKQYDATIALVRPLLDMWRAETVAYSEGHGLEPHYDATNESTDFLRNRVRHELIPALENYNPRLREAVWRAGQTLSLDYELLSAFLQPLWQQALTQQSSAYVELDLGYLAAQSAAVQMHLVQRAAQQLVPDGEAGFEVLRGAAAFLADPAQERADLTGGLFLLKEGTRLFMASDEEALPRDQWPQMPAGVDSVRFTIPCESALASGWRFRAGAPPGHDLPESWKDTDPYETWIDASELHGGLELRVRREGDRFEPLGMDGHSQKVSDFFVNVKLPARARQRWPLLCAGSEVIWVPGYRPADPVRVRRESTEILHLKLSSSASAR